jgi:SAM-dependent methyltransferase
MTGLLTLLFAMCENAMMPNAQLRTLNPHMSDTIDGSGVVLLMQRAPLAKDQAKAAPESKRTAKASILQAPATVSPASAATSSLTEFRDLMRFVAIAAMHLNLIALGAELGYWQTLCDGPKTIGGLASSAGANLRYTKEWCLAMASGGTLQYDEPSGTFSVAQQVTSVFADTVQLIKACDISEVTQNRSWLLEQCRQDLTSAVGATWATLCVPGEQWEHLLGSENASLTRLFDLTSAAALWNSFSATSTAVRHLYLIGLGAELGYWKALLEGSMDLDQLAHSTSCNAHHTEAWCDAMVSTGILRRNEANGTGDVAQHAKHVLMRTEQLLQVCDLSHLERRSALRSVYQTGGGISWGDLNPRIGACVCSATSDAYKASLIPSLPTEIRARLMAGAAIADVGCGHGAAACLLGEVFPKAVVLGCDSHAPSIDNAIKMARHKNLKNVNFTARPSDDFAGDAFFDLICFLDCFHDMSTATAAAQHAHRALKSDGMLFLVEPMAAPRDAVIEQLAVPTASYLSAMSCHVCLPCASCDEGDALGTMCPTETMERIFVDKAGFHSLSSVDCQLNRLGFRLLVAKKSASVPKEPIRALVPKPKDGLPAFVARTLPVVAGVSSFGYAGTIAHVVLRQGVGDGTSTVVLTLLVYRRHAFPWRDLPHPFVQRHLPSSDSSIVFQSPSVGALHSLVADHIVQGRVIFPGAGYLEVARAAGATALCGVYFLQPLAAETPGLLVECALSHGRFEVRSCESEAFEDATVHCSGAIDKDAVWQRVDHAALRVASRAADVVALYDQFEAVGLQYGPGYRTLISAWGGASDALARLRARSTHEGTQVHPADLDDALCTSAAVDSSGGGETRLPFAMDDALLQGSPGKLWAVRLSNRHALSNVQCLIALAWCSRVCRLWRVKDSRRSWFDLGLFRDHPKHSLTALSRVRCVRRRQRSGICTPPSGTKPRWRAG